MASWQCWIRLLLLTVLSTSFDKALAATCSYYCTWYGVTNAACLSQCQSCVNQAPSGCYANFNAYFDYWNGYYSGARCYGYYCPLAWWVWLIIVIVIIVLSGGVGLVVYYWLRKRRQKAQADYEMQQQQYAAQYEQQGYPPNPYGYAYPPPPPDANQPVYGAPPPSGTTATGVPAPPATTLPPPVAPAHQQT